MTHVPVGLDVIVAIFMVQQIKGFHLKMLLSYRKECNIVLLISSLISET